MLTYRLTETQEKQVSKPNACIKAPSGNVITPGGRLCYPNLFEAVLPQGETDDKKRRYQASMVFPKTADLTLLNAMVEEVAIAEWGPDYRKNFKVRKPFLKTEEHPKIGVDAEEFPVLIRTNSPTRPQIIRGDKSPVTEKEAEDVYAGRWARLSLRCYAYDHKTGGKGISFGLQNVQLLDHDEPLAQMRPPAENEFEAIESGGGEGAMAADSLFD